MSINEYHLKHYINELILNIISGEYNDDLEKYTIRTYSKIYNSFPLEGEYYINSDYKFLIKNLNGQKKQELLTEQIVIIDTEVKAVNVEHARSIAYNHTSNTNAYLSILLDIGFELVNSEFRHFIIKEDIDVYLRRYRTGFIDTELKLLVKDNHNGLKDLNDIDELNSFVSGKVSFSRVTEDKFGNEKIGEPFTFNMSDSNRFEELFKKHKIRRKKSNSKPVTVPISKSCHYLNSKIEVPSDIRKFFKNISSLDSNRKEAFLSCARMYNLSLTVGKYEPTLEKSYQICAIEALSKCEKSENPKKSNQPMDFSEFMVKYAGGNLDKKLSDYFYSVRSGHFHAGKFYFNEYNLSLLSDIDFNNKVKRDDSIKFNNYLRSALIHWVKLNILI